MKQFEDKLLQEYFIKADFHIGKDQYDLALCFLHKILFEDRTNNLVFEDIAECYWGKADYEKMKKPTEKALKIEVKNANALFLRGVYKQAIGENSCACHCFKMADRFNNRFPDQELLRRWGWSEYIVGNGKKGLILLDRAFNLDKHDLDTVLDLTAIFIDLGLIEKARKFWYLGSMIDPNDNELLKLAKYLK